MYGFIYQTTNLINGKRYVGMCKNTHRERYLGSGKLLKQAIKKYGRENFQRIVLEECETLEQASESEKKWIQKLNPEYNISLGGFGGNPDTLKEYWNSIPDKKKARNWGRSSVAGSKNPMYGRKHSEKTKKLIGSKSINRKWGRKTPVNGANNPRALPVIVVFKDRKETFDCLKDASDKYGFNYSTLKALLKSGKQSKKYQIRIQRNQ